jgi:hypothetical protein
MNEADFLRNLKDDLSWCESADNLDHIKGVLQRSLKKIDAQLADPEVQPKCGLYLHDGTRQYGYSFEQLQNLLEKYDDPKSVFHKYKRGFPKLLKWLHDVAGTSIGDLHGDMLRHVMVTYHRPEDFSDEELDEAYKKYDAFWGKVSKLD